MINVEISREETAFGTDFRRFEFAPIIESNDI
jgi:hypothetical protein